MPSSLNGTGITFNDNTTQSTASVTASTDLGGVGSYAFLLIAVNNNLGINGTIAGSSLRYNYSGADRFNSEYSRMHTSTYDGGGTSLAGTWRKMASGTVYIVVTVVDEYGNASLVYNWRPSLYVRIS